MSDIPSGAPILITFAMDIHGKMQEHLSARILAASLQRSQFGGTVVVFKNHPAPLFRVQRAGLIEVDLDIHLSEHTDLHQLLQAPTILDSLGEHVSLQPGQWVAIAPVSSISLRNIDHLFPLWNEGSQDAAVGFLGNRSEAASRPASFNPAMLWASRAQFLPDILASLFRNGGTPRSHPVPNIPWSQFETNEVVELAPDPVGMRTILDSAFVSFSAWNADEAYSIQQSLYYGRYLGDPSGIMSYIIDP